MGSKTRYTFVLKNVRVSEAPIQKSVSKKLEPVITYESSDVEESTAISDVPCSVQEKRRLITTMYDVQRCVMMPLATDIPCWWCRHEFPTRPLGAPVVYHPNSADDPKMRSAIDDYFREMNIQSNANDYFETKGVFCSVPCMKAYVIKEFNSDGLKNCLTLITLLHSKLGGSKVCPNIPRAPDWRLIDRYGGSLTIEQFRNAHPRFSYRPSVNVRRPFMFPTGSYYEQIEKVVI